MAAAMSALFPSGWLLMPGLSLTPNVRDGAVDRALAAVGAAVATGAANPVTAIPATMVPTQASERRSPGVTWGGVT